MNALVEFLFFLLIEFVGYGVARLIVPILSCGRIQVHPLGASGAEFNLFGFRRVRRRRLEVSSGVAGFLGLLIVVFAAAVLIRAVF